MISRETQALVPEVRPLAHMCFSTQRLSLKQDEEGEGRVSWLAVLQPLLSPLLIRALYDASDTLSGLINDKYEDGSRGGGCTKIQRIGAT